MDQIPQGSSLPTDASMTEKKTQFKGFQEYQDRLFQLDQEYPNGLGYQLTQYDGTTETHLNIDNLVEDDKEKRERANFFVCAICAMVVKDP